MPHKHAMRFSINNSRTGAYLVETRLTPANVKTKSFGRLYSRTVDGDVLAQPLYERAVNTPSQGVKNLFFIATSKNNVYAFDADNLGLNPTDGLVWQQNLCSSVPSGVCGETASHLVGITSTPVIDVNTHTMYVVTRCSNGKGGETDGAVYIHALNTADGTDRVPPVLVQAKDPNNGSVTFDFHARETVRDCCYRRASSTWRSPHSVVMPDAPRVRTTAGSSGTARPTSLGACRKLRRIRRRYFVLSAARLPHPVR